MDPDDEEATDAAEGGPKGRNEDSDGKKDTLLLRLHRWERLARNHWSEWRMEARLAYDMVAGHQWNADDKAALIEQLRQPVTFNRIAPMVDAVSGAEILNRQEVRFSPRQLGDVGVNDLITGASQWTRELADTEDEESDSFVDLVVTGMAWTETRMDYSEDPEGRIVCERVDPLEMWSDPMAKKRNLADARFVIRARWWDKDNIPKEWQKKISPAETTIGGASVDEVQSGWTGPRDNYERYDDPATKEPKDADKRRVWIRHVQWYDKEPAWRVADPASGKAITVDRKQLRILGKMFLMQGQRPPKAVKLQVNKYYQAFLCGNALLEHEPIEANAFTLQAMTGKRDRNKNVFFGVVRAMVDPQMWGNKFFVQIMHILNTAAKGGLMYETDTFANPRKAIQDWAKPDAAIELNHGALAQGKVKEREPTVFPQGTQQMLEFALNSLPQVSGISLEQLGLVEKDQPAVLEIQRKKAGYAILAVFFDSLRHYRKRQGRIQLYFIQHYISDGRLIKIDGQNGSQQYIPLLRQPDLLEYDVIVDDAPMAPNQKEMVWGMMMQMMPMLQEMQVPPEVWLTMLQYSPLPQSVVAKITKIVQQAMQQPPQPDPKVQIAQIKAQSEQQNTQVRAQAEAQSHQMDMAQQQAEMHNDQQKFAMEQQHDQAKFAMEQHADQARLQAELAKAAAAKDKAAVELERDHAKAMIDIVTAHAVAQAKAVPKVSVAA